jgi:flagellar hook assembly protein FlgD
MSSGETISIVNTRSHHGRYSARFASNGGGGIEYAYCYKTTEPYSELYSRGYFYVSQSGIVDENDRFFFIILKAGTNNVAYAGWRKIGGVVKWVVTMRHGTGYVDTYSTASPSLNRWYSVELHWKGDAGNGLGELYINGAKVIFVTGKNTAAYGDVNQVCFGLPEIYRCIGTTAYCDCAKIGTMYIGSEPTINSFTASPNPFSPNGDGTKDTTTIKASFNVVVNWNLQIRSSLGTVLRTWTGTGNSLAIIWNGKTSAGFKVPDGSYTVRLSGADLLGVTCPTTSVTAYVDTKLPTVTGVSVFPASFNPRIGQTTRINYALSESCYVTIKIYNNVGTLKRTLLNNVLQTSGLHSVVWNGKDGSGIIVSPGTYTIRIYVLDKAGNKATPYPITKTVTVT